MQGDCLGFTDHPYTFLAIGRSRRKHVWKHVFFIRDVWGRRGLQLHNGYYNA